MRNKWPFPRHKSKGSALMLILIILGLATALLVGALKSNPQIERDKITADALAKAKDALIGYAVSPTGGGQRPGDLPRPDNFATTEAPFDYNGKSETGCMDATKANGLPLIAGDAATSQNLRCLGRLPWVDLGISYSDTPENDPAGLMPWYAVSANLVDPTCLSFLNSDTVTLPAPTVTNNIYTLTCTSTPIWPTQLPHPWLTVRDEKGNVISDRVAAILMIPGSPLSTQNRPPSPNLAGPAGYLDSITVPAGCSAPCVPGTYSNADLDNDFIIGNPTNTFNDKVLFITIDELMAAVAKRVAGDAGNALKTFYNTCGFYPRPVNFATSSCYTGTTCASDPSLAQGRFPYSAKPAGTDASYPTWTLPTWFLENRWDSVLYYAVSVGFTSNSDGSPLITVDGSATARALFFTPAINTPTINRVATPTTLTNYLLTAENTNVDTTFIFNNTKEKGYMRTNGPTSDSSVHSPSSPNPVCTGAGGGGTIVKFSDPAQFSKFEIAGGGVTVDPVNQTATINVAGGSGGGCLWFPDPLPLNGKILRSYYEFTFTHPDPPGGSDYGYGFTLSFLEGDAGKPTTCGSQSRMGVIPASTLPFSLFVETDISRESANGEPSGTSNHTAIMANGNVIHSASNGNLTTACNGTAAGCSYALSNKFEESPATLSHNQRVEIHNGYNNTCTATGGTYSLVKAWVDCVACDNTTTNFSSSPTVTRCINLDTSMNDIYFGFTAGFSSTGGQVQGATLGKLELRVE